MEEETFSTDLEEINTEDELATDTSNWSDKERKKLQHMTEFHEEYQKVFGGRESLRTIIRKRISHMNPPIPSLVCQEEMQDAETNEVIVEFITDSKGNRIKRLKPLFIKSEPNKTYIQHIPSDDELPSVPEEQFNQKHEITVDSFSETVSSDDESDDRTVTTDSDSSGAQDFEDTPYQVEMKTTDIEATLNQIASGLQSAANGYFALAFNFLTCLHMNYPKQLLKYCPPPIDVPMTYGHKKSINYRWKK